MLLGALLSGCAFNNPFRGSNSTYVAPETVGEGDCSVQLLNVSSRPLDIYFYPGLRNPPRLTAGWPRVGLLEPGRSSVLFADCEHRRVVIHAYATSPVDVEREYREIGHEVALVEGRRDVLRLRLVR
jgi:hypothetical protein